MPSIEGIETDMPACDDTHSVLCAWPAACSASHADAWPRILARNLRSLYFCHLELSGDASGRAGALKFAERMLRGLEKGVFAPAAGSASAGGAGGGGRKRKSAGSGGDGASAAGRAASGGAYYDKAAGACR